ncbi:SusC/RagA family TonB-linked outer membrane protein, partial [Hymenobacter rubripertinctus]
MKHPYLAKLALPLLCAGASVSSAHAQGIGTVSGRVLDEKGEGMPGVTVLIEGSSLGGSTNSDGSYSIQNVPSGPHTLILSFVGYTTQRQTVSVTAGQNTTVSALSMSENTTLLNEAVVIGYGTVKKADVTGSVVTVDEKSFVKGQITDPVQLVQGKVAGVQIVSSGGAPGAGSVIRIRSGSSLSASNDPLIVIDGVPVDNSPTDGASNALALINPNDIATFTVLKDASATAIYGSRASNGVIIITTKKGVQGEKMRVNFSSQVSRAKNYRQADVLSGDQFRQLVQDAVANKNPLASADDLKRLGTANTDWQDAIFRTAWTTDNNVSLTGNAGPVPFRASVGYLNQDGTLLTNNIKRNTASLGLSPRLFDDHLRIDVNVKGSWTDNRFADAGGVVGTAASFDPTQPIYSGQPAYGGYFEFTDAAGNPLGLAPRNPVAQLELRRDRSTVKRSIGNIQLDYSLPFLSALHANLNLGYDVLRSNGTNAIPAISSTNYIIDPITKGIGNGGVNNQYSQRKDNKLLEFYLKYNHDLPSLSSRVEVLGGYSYQDFIRSNPFNAPRRASGDLANPDAANGNPFKTQYTLLSFYGRLNYTILDRYLLTATLRNDQSSRFSKNERSGLFPAVAVAWRIKDEDFLKDVGALTDLKVRLGYGITGQQDITSTDYPYLGTYQLGRETVSYQFGNTYYTTLRPDAYDPNIKWEETTTYNAGLDYGLADNRVVGTVDVYSRTTKDLINTIPAAAGTNFSDLYVTNVGSLRNEGIELGLTVAPIRNEKIDWTVIANATFQRSEITKLTVVDDPTYIGAKTGGISGNLASTVQINSVGFQPYSYYVYKQK